MSNMQSDDNDDIDEEYREWQFDEDECLDDSICSNCDGSGEGMFDGSICPICNGSGESIRF